MRSSIPPERMRLRMLAFYRCPFCGQKFDPPSPDTPVAAIGQDFREHLRVLHPIQDHDLQTSRWDNGVFVRCEPETPSHRVMRQRKQPRGDHAFARLERVFGEAESDTECVVIHCRCGWKSDSLFGESLAWQQLRVHFRNDYRLTCPHCGWRYEDQEREPVERQLARHIGMQHPDQFPWGYA